MKHRTAADVLDALSAWVSRQAEEFPIRDSFKDGMFLRAGERSQVEALRAFRSSGSFEESVTAGKEAFKTEVRFQLAPQAERGDLREMWLDRRDRSSRVAQTG